MLAQFPLLSSAFHVHFLLSSPTRPLESATHAVKPTLPFGIETVAIRNRSHRGEKMPPCPNYGEHHHRHPLP